MSDAAHYLAHEHLRDGTPIEIRSLQPEDEADMHAAAGQISPQSMRQRFFTSKRGFSEKERSFFMKVDFVNHVALVALVRDHDSSAIAGGGRYIGTLPHQAEMAFTVLDEWQGRGIATILLRHLIGIARNSGVRELTAEVLSDNVAMRSVFTKYGFETTAQPDPRIVNLRLSLQSDTRGR